MGAQDDMDRLLRGWLSRSLSRRRLLQTMAVGVGATALSATGVVPSLLSGTCSRIALAETLELLSNPGFEDVQSGLPTGWTLFSGDVESSTDRVHGGQWSVKLVDPDTSSGVGLRSGHVPVSGNGEYRGSVYSYNLSGSSQLYVEFWDASNQRIAVQIGTNSTQDEWSQIAIEVAAPADAASATLLLYSYKSNVGTSYFDDASFKVLPAEPPRDFPLLVSGHPRLYFTADDIPALRERAKDMRPTAGGLSTNAIWMSLESNANRYLTETSFSITYYGGYVVTYPLPPRQPDPMPNPPGYNGGPYPYWTMMGRAIQDRLENLAFAYVISGDERYGQLARQYAVAMTDWESWTDPTYPCGGQACLDTSHITMGMCAAYDMLYDLFTSDESRKVASSIEQLGVLPLYHDSRTHVDHNIAMLKASGLGTGGALLLGASDEAERYLTRATEYYSWWLDRRMNSGQQEGILYTTYSTDNLVLTADQIRRTTGVQEWIAHPFLNDFFVRWLVYSLAPGGGGVANFSDADAANYGFMTMSVINSALEDGHAGWYLRDTHLSQASLLGFLYSSADAKIVSPETDLPESSVLDEIGWGLLRTGWGNDDVLLAFASNNSTMGHNHYDQNSFLVATNSSWVASDPGYEDYSPGPAHDFTVSLGHSTIQVDQQGQSRKGGGQLTTGLLSPAYDYIKGSAADAYQDPKLTQFDRHIVFVKPHYFVMLDELQADQPRTFDWIMHNGNGGDYKVDGEPCAVDSETTGRSLYVRMGGGQLEARFLASDPVPIAVKHYAGAEQYGPNVRVGSGSPKTSHRFLTVLQPGPYEVPGLVQAENLLPPADSSGKEYKVVASSGSSLVFYRAAEVGDFITFRVSVSDDGSYQARLLLFQSPLYGKVQVYLDGSAVGPVFDGYNATVRPAEPLDLGEHQLSKGEHEVRIEVVGKNDSSPDMCVGVDAIQIAPAGASAEPTPLPELQSSRLESGGAVGAKIQRGQKRRITDLVMFSASGKGIELGGVSSDASQTVVSHDTIGRIERYAMTGGTSLKYEGRVMLAGDVRFSASLAHNADGTEAAGTVEVERTTKVRMFSRPDAVVELDGTKLDAKAYSYKYSTGLLSLTLSQGLHMVRITGPDIFETEVERKAGVPDDEAVDAEFGLTAWEAERAVLVLKNHGLRELQVTLNGHQIALNDNLQNGSSKPIVIDVHQYMCSGLNQIRLVPDGTPEGSATVRMDVGEPA